jgi:hypothetical protein
MLLEQIRSLANEPLRGERAPLLARIEHLLTDGYAAALQLEAERIRLEKQIGKVATDMDRDGVRKANEIAKLATRLSEADGDLSHLRRTLKTLSNRAAAVRSAA